MALAEAAIFATRENPPAAVELLQAAFERADKQLPMQLYDALGVVAMGLLSEGEAFAARAHLMLQFGLSGGKDEQTLRLIVQIQASPEVHLLLKENQPLVEAPADALWKCTFDTALEAARSGRWRLAAEQMQSLAEKAGQWPAIEHNIAVLRSWLAQGAAAIQALRSYAAQKVPLDDAVEAEATAQVLDDDGGDQTDIVRTVYPVTDVETLLANLTSSRQSLRMPGDLRALAAENEPPPKGYFSLLDRPKPAAGASLTLEAIPRILGQVLVFGKQTDRAAQIELMAARPDLAACHTALSGGCPRHDRLDRARRSWRTGARGRRFIAAAEVVCAGRGAAGPATRVAFGRPPRAIAQTMDRTTATDFRRPIGPPGRGRSEPANCRPGGRPGVGLGGRHATYGGRLPAVAPRVGPRRIATDRSDEPSVLELPYARLERLEVEKLSDHDLLVAHDRDAGSPLHACDAAAGPRNRTPTQSRQRG